MGKHHFVIKHNEIFHKCYLDEDGRVYLLDEYGSPNLISAPSGISEIEHAKEAAKVLIKSMDDMETEQKKLLNATEIPGSNEPGI